VCDLAVGTNPVEASLPVKSAGVIGQQMAAAVSNGVDDKWSCPSELSFQAEYRTFAETLFQFAIHTVHF
jgi:hypothetical protein